MASLPEDIQQKNKLGDRMKKQLLNSVIAKYRDLSVSRRSIICFSLRLRQIIDLLATDKSRYFAQPRPIIANYYVQLFLKKSGSLKVSGKLTTYPSPKLILTLTSHSGQNVGLGKGWVGSFPET